MHVYCTLVYACILYMHIYIKRVYISCLISGHVNRRVEHAQNLIARAVTPLVIAVTPLGKAVTTFTDVAAYLFFSHESLAGSGQKPFDPIAIYFNIEEV